MGIRYINLFLTYILFFEKITIGNHLDDYSVTAIEDVMCTMTLYDTVVFQRLTTVSVFICYSLDYVRKTNG